MTGEKKGEAGASLERRLVELAWTDPGFAELLTRDPRQALARIGVQVSPNVNIDVRQQRRDTLYFYHTDGVGGYFIPDGSLTWLLRDMRSTWAAAGNR